jgi:hypothetical protein
LVIEAETNVRWRTNALVPVEIWTGTAFGTVSIVRVSSQTAIPTSSASVPPTTAIPRSSGSRWNDPCPASASVGPAVSERPRPWFVGVGEFVEEAEAGDGLFEQCVDLRRPVLAWLVQHHREDDEQAAEREYQRHGGTA